MESTDNDNGNQTTLNILNKYIILNKDNTYDAKLILSTECYEHWVKNKRKLPKFPEQAFQKIISGHLRGDLGLSPFSEAKEKAILKELRKKRIWGCFEHTNLKIGLRGFQKEGYWERENKRNKVKNNKRKLIETEDINKLLKEYLAKEIEFNSHYLSLLETNYRNMK